MILHRLHRRRPLHLASRDSITSGKGTHSGSKQNESPQRPKPKRPRPPKERPSWNSRFQVTVRCRMEQSQTRPRTSKTPSRLHPAFLPTSQPGSTRSTSLLPRPHGPRAQSLKWARCWHQISSSPEQARKQGLRTLLLESGLIFHDPCALSPVDPGRWAPGTGPSEAPTRMSEAGP